MLRGYHWFLAFYATTVHSGSTLKNPDSYFMGRISISVVRDRLYLHGTLPLRDGSPGRKQTRISLKLDNTPANLKVADRQRILLQRQVDQDTFTWADWADAAKGATWREAINALHKKRVVLGRLKQTTWDISYMGYLRQLPMTKVVTGQEVQAALGKYERHQCAYKDLYYMLKDICALIAVPFPEVPCPTYEQNKIIEVPTDSEIIDWVKAAAPVASWYFGMMATYGLRPQECDEVQFIDDQNRVQVSENTKTGFRTVIPVYPDWVELFDLRNERRRPVKLKTGNGPWLFNERKKIGVPYKPYSLRHAFAARLWRVGGSQMDIYTAARLMGHSAKEHERTYRAHISPWTIAKAAEDAIARNQEALQNALSNGTNDKAVQH